MKRIRVPEGMLKAAYERRYDLHPASAQDPQYMKLCSEILEAALFWISNNPQVPTDEQLQEIEFSHQPFIYDSACDPTPGLNFKPWHREKKFIYEWQRRCFFQEEPEIPAEIKDLALDPKNYSLGIGKFNTAIIEAYRRGQRSAR